MAFLQRCELTRQAPYRRANRRSATRPSRRSRPSARWRLLCGSFATRCAAFAQSLSRISRTVRGTRSCAMARNCRAMDCPTVHRCPRNFKPSTTNNNTSDRPVTLVRYALFIGQDWHITFCAYITASCISPTRMPNITNPTRARWIRYPWHGANRSGPRLFAMYATRHSVSTGP